MLLKSPTNLKGGGGKQRGANASGLHGEQPSVRELKTKSGESLLEDHPPREDYSPEKGSDMSNFLDRIEVCRTMLKKEIPKRIFMMEAGNSAGAGRGKSGKVSLMGQIAPRTQA